MLTGWVTIPGRVTFFLFSTSSKPVLVDHRASLDDVGKRKFLTLPGLELRLLGRPARNQSLYRLRRSGSWDEESGKQEIQWCKM
jgi:hypothetical protein